MTKFARAKSGTARKTTRSGYVPGYGPVSPGVQTLVGQLNASQPAAFTPQTPTSSAPAPSSSPTPKVDVNSLPVDPTYDQQIAALMKRRDDSLAGLTQQRTGGLLNYGYSATFDAAGNATGLSFDPNNPYSRAALARKHHQQAKTGTQNRYAASGQLYAGSLINAQNANDQGFAQDEDSRQKQLLSFLARNLSAQADARNAYEAGAGSASGERISRAQSSPLYNPATGDSEAPKQSAAEAADADPNTPGLQIDPSKWIKTAYTNANGHKVRIMGNGDKYVQVNGQWRRV
jgi:hypothetical protein